MNIEHVIERILADAVHPDREFLIHIMKAQHAMSIDLSKIGASLAKLSTDVDALIKNDSAVVAAVAAATATHQAQADGLVPSIDALSAKIEDVLNPPVAEPPPVEAPAGA